MFFGRKADHSQTIAELERRLVTAEGVIAAHSVLLKGITDLMNDTNRGKFFRMFENAVGRELGGDPIWLDEAEKRTFNNALSFELQKFAANKNTHVPR